MGSLLDNFSQEESAKLENIARFYFKLKELMLYTEILGDMDIFLPPVNEIRLSHDRIMRVILAKCQSNGSNVPVELDKAMSSIYNAILQSLDYISISQIEYIQNLEYVDGLDHAAIESICPGTHALIPYILIFQKDVQNLKSKGNPMTEDELESFIQKLSPVRSQIEKVMISKDAIIKQNQNIKDDKKRNNHAEIIIAIGAALIGAVAVVVFEFLVR